MNDRMIPLSVLREYMPKLKDEDLKELGPVEYDQSKVPEVSKKHAENVRRKVYLPDMTESFARGVEYAGLIASKSESLSNATKERQDTLEIYNNQVIREMTDKDVISAPEIIAARNGQATLNNRLDTTSIDYVALDRKLAGKSDISAELNALSQRAKAEHKGIYIPSGNYNLTTTTIIEACKHIRIDGTINVSSGNHLELLWTSNQNASVNWYINEIVGKLRLSGLKNAKVTVHNATELELYADGDDSIRHSIAYSQFNLGKVDKVSVVSKIDATSAGWINENEFYGGRIKQLLMDGNYNHNNNHFYMPKMEGMTVDIRKGSNNFFHDVRFEGANLLNFAKGTFNNIFYRTYHSTKSSYFNGTGLTGDLTINDAGVGNGVFEEIDKVYTEETLYSVNEKTKNLRLNAIYPDFNQVVIENNFTEFYESPIIKITDDLGVLFKSDLQGFRILISFYTTGKTAITQNPIDSYSQIGMAWNTDTNSLQSQNNVNNPFISIFKNGQAGYFKIKLLTGGNVKDLRFDGLSLKLRTRKRTFNYADQSSESGYSSRYKPTRGYFYAGDYVRNTVMTDYGTYVLAGWYRLTTGNTHTASDWLEHKINK